MSVLDRARAAAGGVARQSKRGARRGQLEIQTRRLRRRITAEEALIGRLLYPEIAESRLEVEDASVREAAQRLADLHAELGNTDAAVAALRTEPEPDETASV